MRGSSAPNDDNTLYPTKTEDLRSTPDPTAMQVANQARLNERRSTGFKRVSLIAPEEARWKRQTSAHRRETQRPTARTSDGAALGVSPQQGAAARALSTSRRSLVRAQYRPSERQ